MTLPIYTEEMSPEAESSKGYRASRRFLRAFSIQVLTPRFAGKRFSRGIGILPMTSRLHGLDARATFSQAVRSRTLKDWPKTL
jgi:hypothetical protein